jgi:phosphate/sulfate permease
MLGMAREILEEVVSTLRQALVPSRTNQRHVIWAIRIVVALSALILILFLTAGFGLISSDNAAVVGALLL